MIDLQTDLDRLGVQKIVRERPRLAPYESRRDVLSSGEWGWEELRDYVVSQIERKFGRFPRDFVKEPSIFKRFVKDWGGAKAEAIARYAFEIYDGYWEGRPITVNRFCRAADPFFAVPISEKLARV